MPRYKIFNTITEEETEVVSKSCEKACQSLKWYIGDCHAEIIPDGPDPIDISRKESNIKAFAEKKAREQNG